MHTRILSSTLLRALKPKDPQRLSMAAATNKVGRIANKLAREWQRVQSLANSPQQRQQFDTREVRRYLLNPAYTPRQLPAPSVPKLDRAAARAQLRETNKWSTWRELARKARETKVDLPNQREVFP